MIGGSGHSWGQEGRESEAGAKRCRPTGASPARPLLLTVASSRTHVLGAAPGGTTPAGPPLLPGQATTSSWDWAPRAENWWNPSEGGARLLTAQPSGNCGSRPPITLPTPFLSHRAPRAADLVDQARELDGKRVPCVWWRALWERRGTTCSDGLRERRDPEVRVCEASLEVVPGVRRWSSGSRGRGPAAGRSLHCRRRPEPSAFLP